MPTAILSDKAAKALGGVFGSLPDKAIEAFRGPDMVTPKILAIHTDLRPCTSQYTYGNVVLTGSSAEFVGGSRKRAEIDLQAYSSHNAWVFPKFGNFGRNRLLVDVSIKRADYLTVDSQGNSRIGFRWMPMFPIREDLGANIKLFSEEIEPQQYRLISTTTPLGSVSEKKPTRSSTRLTHKQLITNIPLAAIEYPSVPFYPSFRSDDEIGIKDSGSAGNKKNISAMWAWREQETPIERGLNNFIPGIKLQSPDYALDNRRLEVQLRPNEGSHIITFKGAKYNDKGEITKNASLQLDDGPKRFINIDFINKNIFLELSEKPGNMSSSIVSVYDTSKSLNEGKFTCKPGLSDNTSLASNCTCETDVKSTNVNALELPSRFLHLEELAPDPNFFALYQSEGIETPFPVDLNVSQLSKDGPCCVCIHYIRGIFFSLNTNNLPVISNIDPIFDPRFKNKQSFRYTWSRVPHGFPDGQGQDGRFNGFENLDDNLIDADSGLVFINRFPRDAINLNVETGTAAFFPSVKFAQDNNIIVKRIGPNPIDVKGGIPVGNDSASKGEQEQITLDFQFDTYVKIKTIIIRFVAGAGFEVPKVTLGIIDQKDRIGKVITRRTTRVISESIVTSVGMSLPNASVFRPSDVQQGRVLLTNIIIPSYTNQPFWNQFGQEFALIFGARDGDNSMGIAGIEIILDTPLVEDTITELINITERKYYFSSGSPIGGNNPELFLTAGDSATGYWTNTQTQAIQGANRHRASAFGIKLDKDEDFKKGEPNVLELNQEIEYTKARDLMPHPYTWEFINFIPLDEEEAINFYGGKQPSWTCQMSVSVGQINKVSSHDGDNLSYGQIPKRNVWNAPGHGWTFTLDDNYLICCRSCPRKSMVIDYNFAHFHDNLAIVQTARFWDELPSGFTRIIRAAFDGDDTITSGGLANGGSIPGAKLIDASVFTDGQGNPVKIPSNSGFRKDAKGNFIILDNGGI